MMERREELINLWIYNRIFATPSTGLRAFNLIGGIEFYMSVCESEVGTVMPWRGAIG